ncbi:MAG: putative toxin-antitoxin system toxin component, PIN family [Acidobacteria bacterium]|nr:putative toxin-antitoxin system toxin component, PIN family [Acidobacteriota bacterium]
MPPLSVVVDTNVVVSGLLKPGGSEALILDLARAARFTMVVSDALLREYEGVLRRPHFRIASADIARSMRRIRETAHHVEPDACVQAARDPDDNRVLECALAGGAQYIVTGNTRHFPSEFQGIRVIPPRQFLVILAAESE